LMNLPCIYVMTHDSIGLGEDGPTHQPIEHLSSLRLIPNLEVWRPADLFETVVAWQAACQRQTSLNQVNLEQDNLEHSGSTQAKPSHVGPAVIALSRQNLPPVVAPQRSAAEVLKHGGYVINSDAEPTLVLIGTGSEVGLVVEAGKELRKQGLKVRTVSLPCVDRLTEESIQHLCGTGIPKLVVEAGSSLLWPGILGDNTSVVGIDSFGASGRHTELFEHFGFNVADITAKALEIVEGYN
jgi:transketolase